MKTMRCYVDGSWSPKGNNPEHAGWGVLFEDGTKLSGTIPHHETRQIAGECEAVIQALLRTFYIAVENYPNQGIVTTLVVFYDYQGLPEWANYIWKAKNNVTKRYQEFFTDPNKITAKLELPMASFHELMVNNGAYAEGWYDHPTVLVKFVKVDPSQNKADALATAALGIKSVH